MYYTSLYKPLKTGHIVVRGDADDCEATIFEAEISWLSPKLNTTTNTFLYRALRTRSWSNRLNPVRQPENKHKNHPKFPTSNSNSSNGSKSPFLTQPPVQIVSITPLHLRSLLSILRLRLRMSRYSRVSGRQPQGKLPKSTVFTWVWLCYAPHEISHFNLPSYIVTGSLNSVRS